MANMKHSVLDDLFILVHTEDPPSEKEWDAYLADLGRLAGGIQKLTTLVFTKGGGPNVAQRAQLNKVLSGRPTRAAVISDARMPRVIVTALSWFNPEIRWFAEHRGIDALGYIGRPESADAVLAGVRRMQSELGETVLAEAAPQVQRPTH